MNRLRNILRAWRRVWGGLSLAALVLAWGCTGGADLKEGIVRSTDCTSKVSSAIIRSSSCTEAELRANGLLHDDPDCREIYGDAGWHKLPCSRDASMSAIDAGGDQ